MIYSFRRIFLVAFSFFALSLYAEFVVPPLTGRVVDQAGVLSREGAQKIAEASQKIEARTGAQVAFLSVPTLEGDEIEQASIRVTDAWKLGDKNKDDGILFMMAKSERKIRIEVGQGLEGDLTDLRTKRIIDETILPSFKRGDFDGGVVKGMYAIAYTLNPNVDWSKECNCNLTSTRKSSQGIPIPFLIIFFLLFFVIPSFMNATGGRRGRGIWIPGGFGGGGSGFGSGGFGGGGGFSGGGGGFSGGGASGSW